MRSSLLSVLSCLASSLPRHRSKVHVCESDSERSVHSLGLYTLLYSLSAVQVVYSPGIQRLNAFLETLRKEAKTVLNPPAQDISSTNVTYLNKYSSDDPFELHGWCDHGRGVTGPNSDRMIKW